MASVLELMEHGFPSRTPFADLHSMYKDYLPKELKQLAPKTFCEVILTHFISDISTNNLVLGNVA